MTVRTGNHDMSNLIFLDRALRRAECLFQTTDSASPSLLKRQRGRPEAPIALGSFAALHRHMHSDRMPAVLTYLVMITRLFPARRRLVRVRCRCQHPREKGSDDRQLVIVDHHLPFRLSLRGNEASTFSGIHTVQLKLLSPLTCVGNGPVNYQVSTLL